MGYIDREFIIIAIAFMAVLMAIARGIILNRQKKEKLAPKPSHNKPNIVSNKDEGLKRKKINPRLKKILIKK